MKIECWNSTSKCPFYYYYYYYWLYSFHNLSDPPGRCGQWNKLNSLQSENATDPNYMNSPNKYKQRGIYMLNVFCLVIGLIFFNNIWSSHDSFFFLFFFHAVYKKHHPPMLQDEVWRLEKIGKDGAFHRKLAAEGVNTVQDFLKLSVVDRQKLRRVCVN